MSSPMIGLALGFRNTRVPLLICFLASWGRTEFSAKVGSHYSLAYVTLNVRMLTKTTLARIMMIFSRC